LGKSPFPSNVGVGFPDAVTEKLELVPTVNVVLLLLVKAGAWRPRLDDESDWFPDPPHMDDEFDRADSAMCDSDEAERSVRISSCSIPQDGRHCRRRRVRPRGRGVGNSPDDTSRWFKKSTSRTSAVSDQEFACAVKHKRGARRARSASGLSGGHYSP
jgi:hypothetical protein